MFRDGPARCTVVAPRRTGVAVPLTRRRLKVPDAEAGRTNHIKRAPMVCNIIAAHESDQK